MIFMKEVLCVVLGGGQGTRLYPLTKERCKPAVPLFGKHRLIDIPISNCLNSNLRRIYVLTQFNSESLNKHVARTYSLDPFTKGFIEIMAAEQSMDNTNWFQGTADAVRQNLKHFNDPRIKYILILSGDQLYKINLRSVLEFHAEKNAEVTVACNAINADEAHHFGIMGVDDEYKINRFIEKPQDAGKISDMAIDEEKQTCLGSMGIYVFNKSTLAELLQDNSKIDFGKEIIPDAIQSKKTYAYMFDGYWRDIGTIKTFYEENLMLTEDVPPLDMFDEGFQIFTRPRFLPPAKFGKSMIEKSIIAEGAIIQSSDIKHSIIGLRFRIGEKTSIKDTIIMGADYYETGEQMAEDREKGLPLVGIGKNCTVEKAILDKNVRIGDNVKIINEKNVQNYDGENYSIRDGIVVISKKAIIPSGTVI
jgi:glucose-1-phosphate adenylyltransferase